MGHQQRRGEIKMKILLISANVTLSPYPIYPLGVSMIAAALTKAGHDVLQVDFLQQNNSLEAIGCSVEQFKPDLVGISVRNIDNVNLMNEQYYIQNVENIVTKIREVTDVKVLLGGAGFSLIPDLILRETGADYGIIGEGEVLAVEFANNAEKGIYPLERLIGSTTRLTGGQINSALYDERLLANHRDLPRKNRGGHEFKADAAHLLAKPGHHPVGDGQGGLRGDVAAGRPGAARGEHQMATQPVHQVAEKGGEKDDPQEGDGQGEPGGSQPPHSQR
jgi:lipid biosynthesis B12-binding/radical SAM protein